MNRVVVSRMARWHFAPTQQAARNLLAENVPQAQVHVTGNTVIDALQHVSAGMVSDMGPAAPRMILVTAHRRENFGAPFERILQALKTIADQRSDVRIVFPMHPNPNVAPVARRVLGGHPRIELCAPLDYVPFVAAMKRSHLILSDSGGVQEEAPALGKPVLVLRDETERQEAVDAGVARLVGTDTSTICREVIRLLDDPDAYRGMVTGTSPYGDGHAASRIVDILQRDSADHR
jgi:UDP-N-acetylglucosamine 2-epimerase (non-hydrolysing)